MSENDIPNRYEPPANLGFDPSEFGLHPETVPGDAWLVRESDGDRQIMELLLERESYAAAQRGNGLVANNSHDAFIARHHLAENIERRIQAIRELKNLHPRP